ncbi:tRNA-specific adenosine deaminase 1 [Armigeres subalbatus]|uniref:tRNA-specific adenosine deaminase 1 n=1 Tax=Armigeres subalbatus TaxID=124917 RepID=UPI002ED27D04
MDLANKISNVCLAKFDNLPKTGKPKEGFEWTILSAIVKVELCTSLQKIDVVALGTGTKCLGSSELSAKGDALNDSHAEIMARRGFLRYLMNEMNLCLSDRSHIFKYEKKARKFILEQNISFHFFTTHSPCGDASIYEQADEPEKDGPSTKRVRLMSDASNIGSTMRDRTQGMTGGKLLQCSGSDLMAQDTGMVRTKPGKGVRTLSVSCSDKMARWNILGIQGSLLMSLLEEPIYLESIIVADGTDYSKDALERALWRRWETVLNQDVLLKPFRLHKPNVLAATDGGFFPFRKISKSNDSNKIQPSPGGIVWCAGLVERPLEVEIGGRRQGVIKKKLGTPAARLKISKIELFSTFISLRNAMWLNDCDGTRNADEIMNSLRAEDYSQESAAFGDGSSSIVNRRISLRYADAKKLCRVYHDQWNILRAKVFCVWSEKPSHLLDFTIDS